MKAIMNGALHFSILDGWWAEGYVEGAGWAVPEERIFENQEFQDELDAETIYDLLENEIAPMFYKRNKDGIPVEWIGYIKKSIAEIVPNFTTNRMFIDYEEKYYKKLYKRNVKLKKNDFQLARDISLWKRHITRSWNGLRVVSYHHPDISKEAVTIGEGYKAEVVLDLNGLSPGDIGVEVEIRNFEYENDREEHTFSMELRFDGMVNGTATFRGIITPVKPGVFEYGIRIFAKNIELPHRQDFPLVRWL
jgi:phosphorylase/glycogen(starch) synthase